MRSLSWAIPLSLLMWAAILFPSCSHAAEYELLMQAYHYDLTKMAPDTYYNNQVYGVGYSDHGYGIGVYHNSVRQTTVYAVKQYQINSWSGYELGLATGYKSMYGLALQPLAVYYVHYGHLKLRVIPGQVTAFGLSITF
jgi:hypothetical protein